MNQQNPDWIENNLLSSKEDLKEKNVMMEEPIDEKKLKELMSVRSRMRTSKHFLHKNSENSDKIVKINCKLAKGW